jgi:hypothetical protein
MNDQYPSAKEDVLADDDGGIQEIQKQGYEDGVKKARRALYWTAGLILAGELISLFNSSAEQVFASAFTTLFWLFFALGVPAIFLALAFWTRRKPYTAVVTGLVLFIVYWLFVVLINGYVEGAGAAGQALIKGLLIKIFILVNLSRSLGDARELQAMQANERW